MHYTPTFVTIIFAKYRLVFF